MFLPWLRRGKLTRHIQSFLNPSNQPDGDPSGEKGRHYRCAYIHPLQEFGQDAAAIDNRPIQSSAAAHHLLWEHHQRWIVVPDVVITIVRCRPCQETTLCLLIGDTGVGNGSAWFGRLCAPPPTRHSTGGSFIDHAHSTIRTKSAQRG
jgi:hypothetical protein